MTFHARLLAALAGALLAGSAPAAFAHGASQEAAHDANHGKSQDASHDKSHDKGHAPARVAAATPDADTAFGRAGDPAKAARKIRIEMSDTMRFTPDAIEVRRGETVSFEVVNAGRVLHEMVIGTEAELEAHAQLMKKFPGMEHDEPYMAHVDPGKAGRIVWQFTRPGEYRFACLVPGHFESGMTGRITVTE